MSEPNDHRFHPGNDEKTSSGPGNHPPQNPPEPRPFSSSQSDLPAGSPDSSPGWHWDTSYGQPSAYGAVPTPNQPEYSSPQPPVITFKPQTVGSLFDGTFAALRFNPKVMFAFSLTLLFIIGVGTAIISMIIGYSDPISSFYPSDFYSLVDSLDGSLSPLRGELLSSAASFLAGTFLSGILVFTVSSSVIAHKVTIDEAWQKVRTRFWKLLGAAFLNSAAISILSIIIIYVAIFTILKLAESSVGGLGTVVYSLMTLALAGTVSVAAIAYMTVRLLFTPMVVMMEDSGPFSALKRSWQLTREAFWRCLGRIILITIVVGIGVSILGGSALLLIGLLSSVLPLAVTGFISMVITSVLSGLILPVSAAFHSLMYIDERIRKEDLATSLDRAWRERLPQA